jgi:adenosylmethionine-8-amino-7-oxononanoate aminotransferase
MVDAIIGQVERLQYYSLFGGTTHGPSIELSKLLCDLTAHERMTRTFFATGGSEAIESALKIARQYWKLTGEPERFKFNHCGAAITASDMVASPPTGHLPSAECMSR